MENTTKEKGGSRSLAVTLVLTMLVSMLAYLATCFYVSRWANNKALLDLMPQLSYLALDAAMDADAVQTDLLSGKCHIGNELCGKWQQLSRGDFTKLPEKPETIFLAAYVDVGFLSKQWSMVKSKELPNERNRSVHANGELVISFGEAYGEIQGWLDAKPLGFTSRHISPEQKFFPIASTEALPIRQDLIGEGRQLLLLRISHFQETSLPALFRISTAQIIPTESFLRVEMMNTLGVAASMLLTGILGLYHLNIWFKRRDPTYLGYAILGTACAAQGVFFFNTASYFGAGAELTWRCRLSFFHFIIFAYFFFCSFVRMPISFVFEHFRAKYSRLPGKTSFETFRPWTKALVVTNEFLALVIIPSAVLFALVGPLSAASTLVYKFSLPLGMVLVTGQTVFYALWFYRTALQENIRYAFPMAAGFAFMQGGILAAMASSLGYRNFSSVALAYSYPFLSVALAVTLGNKLGIIYAKVRRHARELVAAARGTGELAEKLQAQSRDGYLAATQQAAAISQTSSSLNSFAVMLTEAHAQAQESARAGDAIAQRTAHGTQIMTDLGQSMNSLSEVMKRLDEVERVSDSISTKTSLIDDIVFQTQLLSFNASIEAAHAGHKGKGFAVVAEEIGNLADSSGKTAGEISAIINDGRSHVSAIVRTIKEQMSHGQEVTTDAVGTFEDVSRTVENIVNNSHEIEHSSSKHQSVVRELSEGMTSLEQSARNSLAQAEKLAAAATFLAEEGSRIQRLGRKIDTEML